MTPVYALLLFAGLLAWTLAIGWLCDKLRVWWLRRGIRQGGSRGYVDSGLRHREIDRELGRLAGRSFAKPDATGGSRQRGLDVAEGLSDHLPRRSRASESLLGTGESDLSADAQYPRAGRNYRWGIDVHGTPHSAPRGAPTRVK